jgi:hypothetical protein
LVCCVSVAANQLISLLRELRLRILEECNGKAQRRKVNFLS